MDVNGDGRIDILSGSYSRMKGEMAGVFQVLWGQENGSFKTAEVLNGTDGEPLIVPANKKEMVDKICTRPTAVDLDGDGHLDIVTGNFRGTFAVFAGTGAGEFAPKPSWLELANDGGKLAVSAHSDPFFVDWDGDGDLDLLSGSSGGGVFLFTNVGSTTAPEFAARTEILKAAGRSSGTRFGDGHLTAPQSSTRIWIDDINGDGKLDILIGDNSGISTPADGLDEATALKKLAAWDEKSKELMTAMGSSKDRKAAQRAYSDHWKNRDKIVNTERTGFVWLLLQKSTIGNR